MRTPWDDVPGSELKDSVYEGSLLGSGYMFSCKSELKSMNSPFSILFLIALGTGGRSVRGWVPLGLGATGPDGRGLPASVTWVVAKGTDA